VHKDEAVTLGIGLMVGAAIGLTLGILFAPDSGKETRRKIKQKANELVESVQDRMAGIAYKGEQKIAPYD
jgi:gas vesicle protein